MCTAHTAQLRLYCTQCTGSKLKGTPVRFCQELTSRPDFLGNSQQIDKGTSYSSPMSGQNQLDLQVVGNNHPSVHLKSLWFLTYLPWDKLHSHDSTAMGQGTGCYLVRFGSGVGILSAATALSAYCHRAHKTPSLIRNITQLFHMIIIIGWSYFSLFNWVNDSQFTSLRP